MLTKNESTGVAEGIYVKVAKPPVRNKEMEHNKPLDLCSTCNYSQSCIHHKDNETLIIYCEEFDDYVPAESSLREQYKITKESGLDLEGKEMKMYMGLCRNCDFRETCTHIRPESGIWHCEDYQ